MHDWKLNLHRTQLLRPVQASLVIINWNDSHAAGALAWIKRHKKKKNHPPRNKCSFQFKLQSKYNYNFFISHNVSTFISSLGLEVFQAAVWASFKRSVSTSPVIPLWYKVIPSDSSGAATQSVCNKESAIKAQHHRCVLTRLTRPSGGQRKSRTGSEHGPTALWALKLSKLLVPSC